MAKRVRDKFLQEYQDFENKVRANKELKEQNVLNRTPKRSASV